MPAARWLISGWNLIDSGEQVGVHAEAVAEIRVAGDLLICEIRGFSLDFSSDYFAVADAEDVDFGRFFIIREDFGTGQQERLGMLS